MSYFCTISRSTLLSRCENSQIDKGILADSFKRYQQSLYVCAPAYLVCMCLCEMNSGAGDQNGPPSEAPWMLHELLHPDVLCYCPDTTRPQPTANRTSS